MSKTTINNRLVWIAMLSAGLGGILYGYDIGVISGALTFIRHAIVLTRQQTEIIVGAVLFGGLLGTVFTGSLADRYGRRTLIIAACVIFTVGILFILVSHSFVTLLLARLLLGVAVGVVSVAVPLYLSEIAPAHLRGRSVTMFQIFLTFGILLAYFVDYLLTPSGSWRGMFAVILIPNAILFVNMLILPETPRWLIVHGHIEKAREILAKMRTSLVIDTDTEIKNIQASASHVSSRWRTLFKKAYLPALILTLFIAICNQLTGVNIILQYAPTVIHAAGMSSATTAMIATVGIGGVQFIFTLLALALIDVLGRKFLLIVGTAGLVICDIYLGYVAHAYPVGHTQAVLSIIGLLAYILFYGIGPGVVVWLVLSEHLPTKVRGKALALCLFINTLAAALLSSVFLTIVHAIGMSNTYWLFGFFTLLYFLAARFFLPETKGKTLEAIQESLEQKQQTLSAEMS